MPPYKKIAMKTFLTTCVVLLSFNFYAQDYQYNDNKGKFYVYWGWNRGYYSDSDIQFKGDGYNFTIKDAHAHDRQTTVGIDPYLTEITIPQTNFRLGYFINDHYDISLGVDHMKYIMTQDQTVPIYGTINTGGDFDGVYNGEDIILTEDFLTFEHTDGLNYLNIEVNRNDNVFGLLKMNVNPDKVQLNTVGGLGVGILYPKTNTALMGFDRYDEFHVAGYGISGKIGLNLTLFKYFFIQTEGKVGYINMPDIRTTQSKADKAKQDFMFFSNNILVGAKFRLWKNKN